MAAEGGEGKRVLSTSGLVEFIWKHEGHNYCLGKRVLSTSGRVESQARAFIEPG